MKHLFSVSASNDLPNLEVLIINGAVELEELIGCEQRKGDEKGRTKVELPKLKLLIFMDLSTLRLGTELLTVKHRVVHNCPELSLTSTTSPQELSENFPYTDFENTGLSRWDFVKLINQMTALKEVSTSSGTNKLPSSSWIKELESGKEFIEDVPCSEVLATATSTNSEQNGRSSPSPLDMCQRETHSQDLVDGQSTSGSHLTDQQKPLGETESTIGIPQQKWDPMPVNTSPFQMNQEDPSTSKSKPPSSQVNDNNQSILGSVAEMVCEHKQIVSRATLSETDKFLELDRESERTSHLQSLEQKLSPISSPNMTELVDEESSNEAGFPDQHAVGQTMNIEEIGKESIQEWPPSEETTVKTLSAGVDSIDLGGGVATHTDSSGRDILARDSQVVEQDDKLNEGKTGITPCKKIQIQQGSNLMDKKEGTGIVSNDSIEVPPDIHTRLGACKHFVDLDDAQIALLGEAIAAYPHLWNAYEKFSERFHAWMLKTMADMLLFLRNESTVGVTPQREKEFHELSNEAVQLEFERSWVDKMRQLVVARDPELEGDHARERIHELLKRSTGEDVVPDSQVVEQNDRQIEHWRGTSLCEKIQNVDNSIQEESNMINKEGEIGVVSNDPILAPRNEEPEKGFVAKVSTSETPEITTPLTNTELLERPSPSYLDIPLHKTLSNELVDRQSMSEPCLMNQQKPLGEISIKTVAKEGTTSKNTNVAAQSMHSESASSQSGQLVTSQSKSYSHSENRSSSQTETYTAKEREGHPKNIQNFGFNDITSVFQPVAVEEDGEGQVTTSSVVAGTAEHHSTKDNRVVKALADLETCLQMPLKDIASSETNSLRLLTALNFLSNLPLKDVTLSDGLKDIIDSMHKEFPGILSSFKQAFAANDKLEVLEAHWNEVSITLVSKISKAKNFTDEAQQKEAVLKEQIIRLKKEMKDCETVLSSLQEEKKKCIAETTGYKKELENVKKNKSQMVEDQRKVQQELFEVAYKWSALCSQFEYNRIAARNPP
ncbi:hypothetical protein E2542_SST21919 [Spatholobus suberectus]|nr:hypothetical protein E2542_SST21919 [Spatholobus suberectus]